MRLTKKLIKEYFGDYNWDITFEYLIKRFNVSVEDIPKLKKILEDLEEEGWVLKNFCAEHNVDEYDPGEKFGWWK